MDKTFLFNLLVKKSENYACNPIGAEDEQQTLLPEGLKDESRGDHLYSVMYEVNKRKHPPLPDCDFHDDEAVENLRKIYNDNVALISAILGFMRPNEYLFYNPLKYEDEIFEGIQYFADVIPEFSEIDFDRVGSGKKRFERYLKLNDALFKLADYYWPGVEVPHYFVEGLLYQGLGPLFTEYSDYHRYWILATKQEYFDALDNKEEVIWSARKAMQAGDKLFIYRTSPVSAITDIFEAVEDSYFHPISAWDGFWVKMRRVCKIPPIKFSEMKVDPVLQDWWVVKKQFTGTVTDPVSFNIYNRLLELIPESIRQEYKLVPEPVAKHGTSGVFDSEQDFEEKVITPLLKRFDIKHDRQYPCKFFIGAQTIRARVDYVLYKKNRPYSIIENKIRILNSVELDKAVGQAKSYALQIGVGQFVVASPEGYWFYELNLNKETLVKHITSEQAPTSEDVLSKHILPN